MSEASAVDLVRFVGEESSVVVRVCGRLKPGILAYHDYLRAQIVVDSGFARGQVEMPLSRRDLDDWQRALDEIGAGHGALWPEGGRGPEIHVEATDTSEWIDVVVSDPVASMTSISVALCLPDDWLADHRQRLELVRRTWPSEVVETSYGGLTWRT
jgi:hypothetical protein